MLIVFNKPYGVLTQFRGGEGRPTLADYIFIKGVHPAGRLDLDSEGLLLLTDDGALQARIADPRHKLPKRYWVQVEREPDEAALAALREGVVLNDGPTLPAEVRRLDDPGLPPREPPVRFRKSVPTAWIELVIREGRNRQVRRMTAAVGHPTLRLVRVAIGPLALDGLAPGEWREADPAVIVPPTGTGRPRGPRPEPGVADDRPPAPDRRRRDRARRPLPARGGAARGDPGAQPAGRPRGKR